MEQRGWIAIELEAISRKTISIPGSLKFHGNSESDFEKRTQEVDAEEREDGQSGRQNIRRNGCISDGCVTGGC